MSFQHQDIKTKKLWKSFTLNICLVVLVFVLGIFLGLFVNNKRLIESEILVRAQSHFHNIVLARRWNAAYGGVYVEKRPGVESNPYLENPDIHSTDGKTYTKKNPALMTREISELADEKAGYRFHITSLNPLNPNNTTDDFEKKALASFERGNREIFEKEKRGDTTFFRYMAPLYVEKSCLECHAKQGYKKGDVRGGISLEFDITDIEESVQLNRYILGALFALTFSFLFGIIYVFIKNLSRHVSKMMAIIEKLSITDDLTQLNNRRYFFSRLEEEGERAARYKHPVCCLLLDIDYFKKVNDEHGHSAGDVVLQQVAKVIVESCRIVDVVARYGGEEFVLLLPETTMEGGLAAAEKIRSAIARNNIVVDVSTRLQITVSIGVSSSRADSPPDPEDINNLVKLADLALYRAKGNGRNRVEVSA